MTNFILNQYDDDDDDDDDDDIDDDDDLIKGGTSNSLLTSEQLEIDRNSVAASTSASNFGYGRQSNCNIRPTFGLGQNCIVLSSS